MSGYNKTRTSTHADNTQRHLDVGHATGTFYAEQASNHACEGGTRSQLVRTVASALEQHHSMQSLSPSTTMTTICNRQNQSNVGCTSTQLNSTCHQEVSATNSHEPNNASNCRDVLLRNRTSNKKCIRITILREQN
uniref:Uncharacterized protein n=1 Tax=Craspedostauros australis TaxID=1486917 RepID=A0A7R9WVF5_9STRA